MNLDRDKTAWRRESRKKIGEGPSNPDTKTGKTAHDKDQKKELKKIEEDKNPQLAVMATKTALDIARMVRNDAQRRAEVL